MKIMRFLVPCILIGASIVGLVSGNEWNRLGRLIQEDANREPAFARLGTAVASIGSLCQYLGGGGVLIGIALLGMAYVVRQWERSIRKLEDEIVKLRRALTVPATIPQLGQVGGIEGTFTAKPASTKRPNSP
jgi:hypothetical protein